VGRLDQQLRPAHDLGLLQIAPALAPEEEHVVTRHALAGGARVAGLRLRRGQRDDGAAVGAHRAQEAALALHDEVEVGRRGREDVGLRVGVERARADVREGAGAGELLVGEGEVHVGREDFGGAAGVERAEVRVAARLDEADALLLVEVAGEGVAGHEVGALLGRRAAGEREPERALLEERLPALDRHGLAAQVDARRDARRGRLAPGVRADGDLDVAAQLKLLLLRFERGGVGAARDVLAREGDGRGDGADLRPGVVLGGLGEGDEAVARLDLHLAGEEQLRDVFVGDGALGGDLVRVVALVRVDFEVEVFEFVVAVGEAHVARGAEEDVEAAVGLRLAPLEVLDDADDLLRELRRPRPQAEDGPILQPQVGDDDRADARHQHQQRRDAHRLRRERPQPDPRNFFARPNLLHQFVNRQSSIAFEWPATRMSPLDVKPGRRHGSRVTIHHSRSLNLSPRAANACGRSSCWPRRCRPVRCAGRGAALLWTFRRRPTRRPRRRGPPPC
jgi:hypothetical protein